MAKATLTTGRSYTIGGFKFDAGVTRDDVPEDLARYLSGTGRFEVEYGEDAQTKQAKATTPKRSGVQVVKKTEVVDAPVEKVEEAAPAPQATEATPVQPQAVVTEPSPAQESSSPTAVAEDASTEGAVTI